MSRFPLNQPVRVSTTVKDVNGNLTNAGALTLTVKYANADGTTTPTAGSPYTPLNDSVGAYHTDIPVSDLATLGHYQYAWTATGTGAGVSFGDFDVFDPFETAVLPLADAKDQLNIPQTTTTNDAEIMAMIATIETSLEGMTGGPLINRTITERAELVSWQTAIQVRQRPLVSVTSIVSIASGQPIDISAGLDLDANAGIIRRTLAYPFYGPFFVWLPVVTITYVAGWGTAVPAAFNLAARIILAHLWDTQHGPAQRPLMGGQETVVLPGWGFAIPNRAAQLMEGSLNGMSFQQQAYV